MLSVFVNQLNYHMKENLIQPLLGFIFNNHARTSQPRHGLVLIIQNYFIDLIICYIGSVSCSVCIVHY